MDFISIVLLIFFIWLTFKIVPEILGFTISVLLVILQVIGTILLIPVLGLLCFLLDAIIILLIIGLFRIVL